MTFRAFRSVRPALALVSLITGLLALTGSASANRSQESIFQDDRLLLAQNSVNPGQALNIQTQALNELQSLHVKTIHSVINWRGVAPKPSSRTAPTFDATNPSAYPADAWNPIDNLVRGARDRGMSVILTVAGPAPDWGSDCKPGSFEQRRSAGHPGVCRPNATKFGQFVTAVAKRYNGTFRDAVGGVLPKVSRWGIWNEPDLDSWLYPQILRFRGRKISVGAMLYRNLVYAAGNALKRNGHGSDQIMLGETAPVGLGTARTSPATFLQTLFCIDGSGHKLRGSDAKNAGCTGRFKKLPVN